MACEAVLAAGTPLPADVPHASAHLDLDPTPHAPGLARAFVHQQLSGRPADLVETAQLVVSELVTNVVLHAGTRLQVSVTVADAGVLVAVMDARSDAPVALPPHPGRHHGRGIAILEGLSREFGWVAHAHGKTVWALLPA